MLDVASCRVVEQIDFWTVGHKQNDLELSRVQRASARAPLGCALNVSVLPMQQTYADDS